MAVIKTVLLLHELEINPQDRLQGSEIKPLKHGCAAIRERA